MHSLTLVLKWLSCLLLFLFCELRLASQAEFLKSYEGIWRGKLEIYHSTSIVQEVPVQLSIIRSDSTNDWIWRTEYFSVQNPIVKDYRMKIHESKPGVFLMDEGDGIQLLHYRFANQLVCFFQTDGISIFSTYEIVADRLIFELFSGKLVGSGHELVQNSEMNVLQKVVYTR